MSELQQLSVALEQRPTCRADYRPPDFLIDRVDLWFDLDLPQTRVTASLIFRRANADATTPLVLDGEHFEMMDLRLDGEALPPERYARTRCTLTIMQPPARGELTIVTVVRPGDATEGLVHASNTFVTHCEPAGFRRITYFPDRPDVLARYRCTLAADPDLYPTLLSNGNLATRGSLADGRSFATWEDPYPKASYLFALVAEDDGGMAHAVRPSSYLAVNNLYTHTVYERGAELIRMMQTLVGEPVFRTAAIRFFDKCDGAAADIDTLIETVEEVSGCDLARFRRWYDLVGGVLVEVSDSYDAAGQRYELTMRQRGAKLDGWPGPLQIPVRVALLSPSGRAMTLRLAGERESEVCERVLQLRSEGAHRLCRCGGAADTIALQRVLRAGTDYEFSHRQAADYARQT